MRLELQEQHFEAVDTILGRCLMTLLSVDMWGFYLSYVQLRKLGKDSEAARSPDLEQGARQVVTEAFEFALENIGYAYEAGKLWQEYLKFVETAKVNSSYDLGQRTASTRGVFQRVVRNPVAELEEIYHRFEEFEKGNIPAEIQQEYNKARAVCNDRKKHAAGLEFSDIPDADLVDPKLVNRWKIMIDYEKSNPERVPAPDLKSRVRYVYTKALRTLYFSPKVWYDFSCFENDTFDPLSTRTILEKSIVALPESLILHFALADTHELNARVSEAEAVYENLVANTPSPLVFIQYMQFSRRVNGVASARAAFRRARQSTHCDHSVFIAAANLEFYNNKESRTARNVFELGMKRYPNQVELIFQYLNFLEHLNKDSDMISLYERALKQLDPNDALPVWEKYREFKTRFVGDAGSLKDLESLEKRMSDAYLHKKNQLTGLNSIIHRYTYLGNRPGLKSDILLYSRNKKSSLSLGPHSSLTRGRVMGDGDAAVEGDRSSSSSKTPALVRKLESFLPDSLGERVQPMPSDYVIDQIMNFRLPPKSVLIQKKKRRIVAESQENDSMDVFKKRRKAG